ncbi:MAG: phospholipase D-like domain-containing protein [Actinomycetota bacterium]|nr:phospholipase D-like domain-containing protein [Actinomycetota bacterium]
MADERATFTHRCRRHLEGLLGVPATEGNEVTVLRNGDNIFPAMLEAIGAATNTVDILTFVYWTGNIAQKMAHTLADRAKAGCRVRVLLDAFGARLMDDDLVDMLQDAGTDVRFFRPPTSWERITEATHRSHRKVLICDEEVAFTGGVGIAEEWEGDARDHREWRDTHFRFRGPAVDGLRAAFVDNWAETHGPIFDERDRFPEQPQVGDSVVQVIRGEAEAGWSNITTLKRALIQLAQERIRITTAYLSPDDVMLDLLCSAARRGVEVDILLPGVHADKRVAQIAGEQCYEQLMECGVGIYNYQRTMLHPKVMTIDGVVANVGSSNFNSRSFSEDDEVDAVIFDRNVVEVLDAHFDEDLTWSEEMQPGRWDERSLTQRTLERLTALIDHQI